MLSKEEERLMEENFTFIDRVLERDLGIDLHPVELVYENTETMEELESWINEQVHGPVEEKWNDVAAEGVELIPYESLRSMVESGEMNWDEDGDGFEEDIANRIQDELFDYLDECEYCISQKSGKVYDITKYTKNDWYSLRPDEFKYYGGGLEWDYVTYAENYLRRNYPRIKVLTYLVLHIDEEGATSYPFLVYKVGRKWYFHECAIPNRRHSEVFENAAEGIKKIIDDWKDTNGGYTDGMTVVKEYHPYDHHRQHFDELYQSVFEDYPTWMKKYASELLAETGGYGFLVGSRYKIAPYLEGLGKDDEFYRYIYEHGYTDDFMYITESDNYKWRKRKRVHDRHKKNPLKHSFKDGYDYATGHRIMIVYGLDNDTQITGVGNNFYLANHPDNLGKSEEERVRDQLDHVRKTIHIKGNGDFESVNSPVYHIRDVVTNKPIIGREVTVIPTKHVDSLGYSHVNDLSAHPSILSQVRKLVDDYAMNNHSKQKGNEEDVVTRVRVDPRRPGESKEDYIKRAQRDTVKSFKSTHVDPISKENGNRDSRFRRIMNMERVQDGRGHKARMASISGIYPKKDVNKMNSDDIIHEIQTRLDVVNGRLRDIQFIQTDIPSLKDDKTLLKEKRFLDGVKKKLVVLAEDITKNGIGGFDTKKLEVFRVYDRSLYRLKRKLNKLRKQKDSHTKPIKESVDLLSTSKFDALRELFIRRDELYWMDEHEELITDDIDIINEDINDIIYIGYTSQIMDKYRDPDSIFEAWIFDYPCIPSEHPGYFAERINSLRLEAFTQEMLEDLNTQLTLQRNPDFYREPLNPKFGEDDRDPWHHYPKYEEINLGEDINSPTELLASMDPIEYGFVDHKGAKYTSSEIDGRYFWSNYKLQTPEELRQSLLGVCWDQVELERQWFHEHDIPSVVIYLEGLDEDGDRPTHTTLIYRDGDKYKWFEHSWYSHKGIHEFDSFTECVNTLIQLHAKSYNLDPGAVLVTQIPLPEFGINCEEYMKWAESQRVIRKPAKWMTEEVEEKSPTSKNGVNRKNLYIAFIQYAERVDKANKFDTNFTKDIFDKKYTNVPDSMRYFYRLADPTQCILNDGLVFFSLKNAQEINKKNSDITKYYIFAGIGDLFYVVDQKNGAVHEATEEQLRHVRVGKKMAPNFDIYVQKLVNNGDYLDGKVVPPDDRPEKDKENDT